MSADRSRARRAAVTMRHAAVLWLLTVCDCSSTGRPIAAPPAPQTTRIEGNGTSVTLTSLPSGSVSEATVSDSLGRVWAVLPFVYRSIGVPTTTADATSHVFGTEGIKVRRELAHVPLSRFLDCGMAQGASSADSYDVSLAVLTQLQPDGAGGTRIATGVEATARPVMFSGEAVRCTSKGVLEQRILEAIRAQLRTR